MEYKSLLTQQWKLSIFPLSSTYNHFFCLFYYQKCLCSITHSVLTGNFQYTTAMIITKIQWGLSAVNFPLHWAFHLWLRIIIHPTGIKATNLSSFSSSSIYSVISDTCSWLYFQVQCCHNRLTSNGANWPFCVSELETDITVGRIVGSGTSAAPPIEPLPIHVVPPPFKRKRQNFLKPCNTLAATFGLQHFQKIVSQLQMIWQGKQAI